MNFISLCPWTYIPSCQREIQFLPCKPAADIFKNSLEQTAFKISTADQSSNLNIKFISFFTAPAKDPNITAASELNCKTGSK